MCTFDLTFADLQPRFRTSHGLSFHRIRPCTELSGTKASCSLPCLSTRIRHRRAPTGSTGNILVNSTSDPATSRLGGRGTGQLRAAGGPQNQPLSTVPRRNSILRAIHNMIQGNSCNFEIKDDHLKTEYSPPSPFPNEVYPLANK